MVAIVLREYGFAIDLTGIDADLQDIQTHYLDRGGAFLVIVDAGETIYGCAGLYPLDAATAEIRKMYVLPQARGLGWGRRLLRSLIGHARWRGFDRLVLETAARLGAANALYRRFGFAEYASDHLASRCDLAMELHL
ncbi:MAG: GNAT family N-acetyltransferase [Burkholderiales bacterium]